MVCTGSLQTKCEGAWNEWRQDCLAYLLRLVSQFALVQTDGDASSPPEDVFDSLESPRKKQRKLRSERIVVSKLNPTVLAVIDVSKVVDILLNILCDAAIPPRYALSLFVLN